MARKSDPVYYDANGNVVEPPKKKKGGCLKFILIGVIVIIAIAVISSMLGGGSDGDGASDEGAKSVGMGEEFQVGDWSTTIQSVDAPVPTVGQSGVETKAQGEFIPVQLSAKNNAKEEKTFFADNVKLLSTDGTEYSYSTDAVFYGGDKSMFVEATNPGNTASGYLWFDVPAGTEIAQVKVAPGGLSIDEPVVVDVK